MTDAAGSPENQRHQSSSETGSHEQLAIDTIKVLAMDAVQAAKSGHPGTPMALAPVGYALWTRHLRHNPANPDWLDRDRFVLSAGHASMLLYSLLYLTGYDLTLDDIRDFRQKGSRTPGHPEYGHTAGVETTTGPLGQGVSNTVGMALAERWLADRFNRPGHAIVDHHTYALCSDGDLMEGLSHEAAEIAGHQKLGKLTWIFDDNRITIEGSTDLATSTDQATRFEGYGWHTITVADGTDLTAIDEAIEAAKAESNRPTLIILQTRIAEGSPNKVGQASTHGAPLGHDEIAATKANIGYPSTEPFHVTDEALAQWRQPADRWADEEAEWNSRLAAYRSDHPELAAEFESVSSGKLPEGWDRDLPSLEDADANATRNHSGMVLQSIAAALPTLVGGSADLGGSNKTDIKGGLDLLPDTPSGRVVHFGVREHAMGGILNGMALHGGVQAFGGTFLIFSDYMRPSIRLAGLMGLPVTYVFTHDSIGLGEDGPTHQPVEQLMTLRAIPKVMDLRPADGPETAEAWRAAINYREGPSFLALTRQKVPVLDRSQSMAGAAGLHRGGYVLADAQGGRPACILIASGSEVSLAVEARARLEREGVAVRVVSMPSWYLFNAQPKAYQAEVLLPDVTHRVSVEAGSTMGWPKWIGPDGYAIGIDDFGASAPYEELYDTYGITVEHICEAVRGRLTARANAS
ncbi:MAG: transketolase [Longimicrobiales bacterium]